LSFVFFGYVGRIEVVVDDGDVVDFGGCVVVGGKELLGFLWEFVNREISGDMLE